MQVGSFIIPPKIELYSRTSHVTGPTGVGSESAGGVNWFILPDKENLKFTVDIANLDHSPADQNRTDYMASQTGWLLRTQIQVYY